MSGFRSGLRDGCLPLLRPVEVGVSLAGEGRAEGAGLELGGAQQNCPE